jgi:hypothetical protein
LGLGQDLGGAPVCLDHTPFEATVHDNPFAGMIRLGKIHHHIGENIAQRALQCLKMI